MTDKQGINQPIQYLKGVGPRLAQVLAKLNIHQIADLLYYYPFRYLDRSRLTKVCNLQTGAQAVVLVKVISVQEIFFRGGKKIFEVLFGDETGSLSGKWFYYYRKSFEQRYQVGRSFLLSGEIQYFRGKLQIVHPDCQSIEELTEQNELAPGVLPVYASTDGVSVRILRKIIHYACENYLPKLQETLPQQLLTKLQLPRIEVAIQKIHFPNAEDLTDDFFNCRSPAHWRLIFEEFFYLQLSILLKKQNVQVIPGLQLKMDLQLVQQMKTSLPFTLTAEQEAALAVIFKDLCDSKSMHRLLQGDVGSGKTVVALLAALLAYQNQVQVAIMVPTEILAEQHYQNWIRLLHSLSITPYLLTSATPTAERNKILSLLNQDFPQIIIGTHALLEDEVIFHKLGLVIIDEQHRFGVNQRMKLMKKTQAKTKLSPHVLVMTATPIPRSLAMTVYGDLDLTLMKGYPRGRGEIITKVLSEKNREKLYGFLHEQIKIGRQIYFVYPLIEESEKLQLKDAQTAFTKLKNIFGDGVVALIHGQMSANEKESIMREFARGNIKILVATTVIEVGIDVANATVMVIEHAERFGLSQLHQLRGRVGRGEHKSYCFLLADYKRSLEARERLKIMEATRDGFKIAEEDLRIRGPGDFLGTRQSGLPDFKMANLVRDMDVLEMAREAATQLLGEDPKMNFPEHQRMWQQLQRYLQGKLKFAQVG